MARVCSCSVFDVPPEHNKEVRRCQIVARYDDADMRKHGVELPALVAKVDQLLGAASCTLTAHRANGAVTAMDGFLQYQDDQLVNFKSTLDAVLSNPGSVQGTRIGNATLVRAGWPADKALWQGPDPFDLVPSDPQWSCWKRMQAPVVDGERVYLVATIVWGGSAKVSLRAEETV